MEMILNEVPGTGKMTLTTESPASSYGIPVLNITAQFEVTQDYGPADEVGTTGKTAAQHVMEWAKEPGRSAEELKAAKLFLRQWPDGPQID